mgnify:CR=1 FL=1
MNDFPADAWAPHSLLWKTWGDEVLVYNQDSGMTHQITPIAARVIHALERQPATVAQLSEDLARELDVEVDAELCHQVASLLENLNHLGLIRRFSK